MTTQSSHTSKPKRVLHFIDSAGVYGAERVILNLSERMLATGDCTPVVGCIVENESHHSDLYDAALALGVEAHKVVISNSRLLKDLPRASKSITELGIDLIHSHGYKPSVFGFFIARLANIKIMSTCHLWFDPKNGPLKMRVMIWLEKKLYRYFPMIIAVSEDIKTTLLSNNIAATKVDVIRNGVDLPNAIAKEDTGALRISLGLNQDDFVVLNSGRLTRQKAQWTLIQTVALLKQQGQQVQLLIVGEGPLRNELQQLIHTEKLEDQVHLLGFRSDINALLALSNVFALPSLDEGMPMSLLEAAASNKPIIATQVGDIGKLIIQDESGCIIPVESPEALAQAIVKLRDNPTLANHLANNAHLKLKADYSSEAMCERYLGIYNQIITSTAT